jgi:hypothetical protein
MPRCSSRSTTRASSLHRAKRAKALEDPELFATYNPLLEDQSDVVDEHAATLIGQLEWLVGEDAKALFQATTRFHHPAHAAAWGDPEIERDLERLLGLVAPYADRRKARTASTRR